MKKVVRNSSRVLSAILSAAMILSSVPASGLTAYAEESAYTAEITDIAENGETTEAEDSTETGDETADAESSAPAEEGSAGTGEAG